MTTGCTPTRACRGASRSSTTTTASCGNACRYCRTSSTSHGEEGPFAKWLENWDPDDDLLIKRVTTRIECSKYFTKRDEALLAHATQIDPNSYFFTTPMEWQQRLWPTEEFELARSRVPISLPETDLFEGIEPSDD